MLEKSLIRPLLMINAQILSKGFIKRLEKSLIIVVA